MNSLLHLFLPVALAQSPVVNMADAPREVQRAVRLSTFVGENRVVTRLDGRSEGYLLVDAQVETRDRFRLYEDRVSFRVEDGSAKWSVEVLEKPTAVLFPDPVTKKLKKGYQGQSVFRLKLALAEISPNPLPSDYRIPLVVSFQACNDHQCLFPASLRLEVALGGKASPSRPSGFLDGLVERLRHKLGSGEIGWGAVAIIFLAGLLTSFTPCVYPLYPITLGVFGRWSAAGHVSPLSLALAYCGGLTASYSAVGVLAVASGQVFGSLTQTPGFLIAVGALILLSALAFSGLFEFPVPGFLKRLFAAPSGVDRVRHSPQSLGLKAFGMGAGLGVVAAPCVGPVLVAVLAWLSTTLANGESSYLKGSLLLALFGAGMSLPFLILGHVILRMGRHPHLGRFTPWFKHVGTVLMIAASLFFLVPGLRLAFGSSHVQGPLPFPVESLTTWQKQPRAWTVLDFRADWCAACLQLESETFRDPQVAPYFGRDTSGPGGWEYVSIDLTANTPEVQKIAKDFGVVSLPTVLIAAPGGKICSALSLYSFESASDFAARLQRASTACP